MVFHRFFKVSAPEAFRTTQKPMEFQYLEPWSPGGRPAGLAGWPGLVRPAGAVRLAGPVWSGLVRSGQPDPVRSGPVWSSLCETDHVFLHGCFSTRGLSNFTPWSFTCRRQEFAMEPFFTPIYSGLNFAKILLPQGAPSAAKVPAWSSLSSLNNEIEDMIVLSTKTESSLCNPFVKLMMIRSLV